MDPLILSKEIQAFISENVGGSISKLALQKNPFPAVEWIGILTQIEAKTKAKSKLPLWYSTENIIYPAKISIEQTSSEKTALYKASIVSGDNLIDLTGGFGIDDYYFSKKVKTVVHCEISNKLSAIVQHNFTQLSAENISCYAGDSLVTLKKLNKQWDWIYIDPSRRSEAKRKVFLLKDCLPNVPENLDLYFQYSNLLLIKTAPILDISAGLLELKNVKAIHIIAIDNEVKELLWELDSSFTGAPLLKTINITRDQLEEFDFYFDNTALYSRLSLPEKYLYEPNSAIMKSGGFDQVGAYYNINKLHKHSHLYTSENLIYFPGRIFEILNSFLYNKTEMKKILEGKQANVTTRNFPDSVESIRKKWKIKDGGNLYCFFTTDMNDNKIVLICTKI